MRTKIFTGILVAAFLSVAAGAGVAYYHSGGDPYQTFNAQHLKALLAPPSLPAFGAAAAIGSANPANLSYYLTDGQLMFYAALALTGMFCCAIAFGRAAKLARALPRAATQRTHHPHAMDIFRLSAGARRLQSESRYGLKSRLTRWFGAIALLLSAASFLLAYAKLSDRLRRHGIESGRTIAINVADAVTPLLVNGNTAELREMLLGYLARNNLAYILVLDGNQSPLAYGGAQGSNAAEAVLNGLAVDAQGQRISHFRNQIAYDLTAPIDSGKLGTVRVGVWRARIEDQVSKVLLVMALLLVAMTYGAILAAYRLFARITRPLEDLAASAEGLSRGDLETPIEISTPGPMAQLGDSLERVRSALKPAIGRLKAELDVPARFTVMGAFMHDAWEARNEKSGTGE